MAKVIDLDLSLEKIEPYSKDTKDFVLNKFYNDGSVKYNYKTQEYSYLQKILREDIPFSAFDYHANYITYVQNSYSNHYKMVISPDILWYTIMCEIAHEVVSNSKQYSSIFTDDPNNKKQIIVYGNEDDVLNMDAVYDQLKVLVPVDTDIFVPKFSTSTEKSRLAILGSFLETCSPYYSYGMLACGIPSIRIEGTQNDWTLFSVKLLKLANIFKTHNKVYMWLMSDVLTVVSNICDIMTNGDDNKEWLSKIFAQEPCGSGSQYHIDGWITNLYLYKPDYPREAYKFNKHISKVPYTHLGSGSEYKLCFGLTHSNFDNAGFLVPDFSMVQFKQLETPMIVKRK